MILVILLYFNHFYLASFKLSFALRKCNSNYPSLAHHKIFSAYHCSWNIVDSQNIFVG